MKINHDNLIMLNSSFNNSAQILMWSFINPVIGDCMNSSLRNSIHVLVESPVEQSTIGTKIWDSAIDSIDKLNEKSL